MNYAQNNNSKIEIIQHNTARQIPVMHSCLEIAFRANIDFILIQEPWIANDNIGTVSHPAYIGILPPLKKGIRPRVAIFARKNTPYSFTARPDISNDSDTLILQVSGPGISSFQLINIYNEKGLGENQEWTIKRSLQTIKPEKRSIICGDFNAHHSWWNSRIFNPIRCLELIPWLERFNFELKNIEDLATFHRSNSENISIIDLTFATTAIESKVDNWHIDEEAYTGSDHEVIRFSINRDSENNLISPIKQERYNINKADWEKFKESILGEYTELAQKFQDLTTES
jgi:exonuclease III